MAKKTLGNDDPDYRHLSDDEIIDSSKRGDEDDILAWMLKRNTTWDPRGGYTVQWAPKYRAFGLPAVPIYGKSANRKNEYINKLADQLSRQRPANLGPEFNANYDYFRLVNIITDIMSNPEYVGEDGALNQYGWAKLAQEQIAGPGSHLDKEKKEAAREIFNTGVQVATFPTLVGSFAEVPATTIGALGGGAFGSFVGGEVGSRFDDPYSTRRYGREIGELAGGLAGGFLGGSYGTLWESPITRTTPTSSLIRHAFPIENENHTITITPSEKPFYYNRDGYFVANPNYSFRNGWGLIDDAVETGVIRVPQVPYKLATFLKYPFLKPDNEFSTMNIDFKFPYFLRGELMTPFKVKMQAPDLIAIPNKTPGVFMERMNRHGTPMGTEALLGEAATPIINGLGNLFPTNQAQLFRLDPTTNMYYQYDPKTITLGEAFGLDLGGLGIWGKYPHRFLKGGISTGDPYYINTPRGQLDPNHKFSLGFIFKKGGRINKYLKGKYIAEPDATQVKSPIDTNKIVIPNGPSYAELVNHKYRTLDALYKKYGPLMEQARVPWLISNQEDDDWLKGGPEARRAKKEFLELAFPPSMFHSIPDWQYETAKNRMRFLLRRDHHRQKLGTFKKVNKYQEGKDIIKRPYTQEEVENLIASKKPKSRNYTPIIFMPNQPLERPKTKAAREEWLDSYFRDWSVRADEPSFRTRLNKINFDIHSSYDKAVANVRDFLYKNRRK